MQDFSECFGINYEAVFEFSEPPRRRESHIELYGSECVAFDAINAVSDIGMNEGRFGRGENTLNWCGRDQRTVQLLG